jgi:hypothetical protein
MWMCTIAFSWKENGKSSHILPYLEIEFLEVGMILEIFYFIFWPLAKFGSQVLLWMITSPPTWQNWEKKKRKKKRLFFCFNFLRVSGLVIIHKKELAKFGYNKSERKIQFFFWQPTIYPLATCWNLWSIYIWQFQAFFLPNIGDFGPFSSQKKNLCNCHIYI